MECEMPKMQVIETSDENNPYQKNFANARIWFAVCNTEQKPMKNRVGKPE